VTLIAILGGGMLAVSGFAQSGRLSPGNFLEESELMQFVSIETFEVRIELIARGEFVMRELDFQLEDPSEVTPQEQERLIARSVGHFANYFTFFPDGLALAPSESQASVLRLGAIDSVVKEDLVSETPGDLVLGIAYVYPLDQILSSFDLSWNRLPEGVDRLPLQLSTPNGFEMYELSEFAPNINWMLEGEPFELPSVEPVAIASRSWWGRPKMDATSAIPVLEQILENIYRAFEYPTEEAIYDNLAKSVAGDTLADLYLEYRRRIEKVARGGPRVKVLDLSVGSVGGVDRVDGGVEVDASWTVSGQITHFGHVHERINEYRARVRLTADEEIWKLLQIEIIEENRLR